MIIFVMLVSSGGKREASVWCLSCLLPVRRIVDNTETKYTVYGPFFGAEKDKHQNSLQGGTKPGPFATENQQYCAMIKILSLTFRLLVINASEIMEDITTPRENVSVLAVLGRLCEIPYTVLTNSVQRPSLLASPCNFTTHLTSGCTETVSALSSRDLQRRKSANFSTL